MTKWLDRARVCAGAALAAACLGQPLAQAASGSYQGTIDSDSGLGLIGQTMRVDFTYDDSVTPTNIIPGISASFDDFLTSMTLTIGASSWQWSAAGYSSVFLYNDTVLGFQNGVEDHVTGFFGTFTGPSLVGSPVTPFAYSLDVYMTDLVPIGAPDGLSAYTVLPGSAPNPDLFQYPGGTNTMVFSFYTGDGELGPRYSITTANIALAAPIPEPSLAWLLLGGLGVVGVAARRRRAT